MKLFRFGALLWVIGGAALVVFGFTLDPLISGTMVFVGFTFIAVGVVWYVVSRLSWFSPSPLLRTGTPGTAVIQTIRETGITINDMDAVLGFDLLVTVPGRPPYVASVRQRVPRIVMPRMMPGALVGVRVDPTNPAKLVIDWNAAPAGVPVGLSGMPALPGVTPGAGSAVVMPAAGGAPVAAQGGPQAAWTVVSTVQTDDATGAPDPGTLGPGGVAVSPTGQVITGVGSAQELLASGEPGRATIVSTFGLGITTDEGDPVLGIVADVTVPSRPPYRTQFGHRVPVQRLNRAIPGTTVTVAVSRSDPNEIAIDWDAI